MFAPSVEIDGKTVEPPAWMWLFAFAIRGFKWAETEVLKPDFDRKVKLWFAEQDQAEVQAEIQVYEEKLKELHEVLRRKSEKVRDFQ